MFLGAGSPLRNVPETPKDIFGSGSSGKEFSAQPNRTPVPPPPPEDLRPPESRADAGSLIRQHPRQCNPTECHCPFPVIWRRRRVQNLSDGTGNGNGRAFPRGLRSPLLTKHAIFESTLGMLLSSTLWDLWSSLLSRSRKCSAELSFRLRESVPSRYSRYGYQLEQ
jgi:hypothetical protein